MLFSKATIIDSQRIRCYKVVGNFTCFRWAVSLAILVKTKCVKNINITISIFHHFPFANYQAVDRSIIYRLLFVFATIKE